MKRRLAIGIAGATAALIGGFSLVRQKVDRSRESGPFPPAQAAPPPVPPSPPAAGSEPASAPEAATSDARPPAPANASKAELYEIAQGLGIEGRSKMSKDQLRQAIEAAGPGS